MLPKPATPPGTFGEASGALSFNITPVPEPAALALLLATGIILRRTA